MKPRTCIVKGCEGVVVALGCCQLHYSRLRRGSPLDVEHIPIEDPRRVVVVLPESLYQRIVKRAGDVPASRFIRETLEESFS